MSLFINDIYCKHWLINDKLLEHINNTKYPVIKSEPHHCFNIFDTIHYNALIKNKYDIYNKLVVDTKQFEHSVDIYQYLLKNFDINKMDKIKLTYDSKLNKYIITDGIHRICIILFKELFKDKIPIKYFDINYPQDIIKNITKLITLTTETKHYNGWNNNRKNVNGYHSIDIYNIKSIGQRTPIKRLSNILSIYDFKDKTVLDLGCNIGGMLLHLPEIKRGIGIDFDETCINCAQYISKILKFNDITFYKYDLNNFVLKNKMELFNIKKIDIIFILSIGSWAKNWRQLYIDCINNANTILLETNNDTEGLPQLQLFKEYNCNIEMVSNNSIDDNTGNYSRKLYLINNK